MKKHFLKSSVAMIATFLCLGFYACGGDDDEPVQLSVTPNSISLGASSGSSSNFSISCNGDWNISGVPDWISVSPLSGSGNSTIMVSASSENTNSAPRTCSLVVTCQSSSQAVNVTQNQVEYNNSIVGTWTCDISGEELNDLYTLVFKSDNSGYIQNDFSTRASVSLKMYFDWSLTDTSDGRQRLSVIYTSGDTDIYPFEGDYAQWSREVTVAGNTLSVHTSDGYVMLFKRK